MNRINKMLSMPPLLSVCIWIAVIAGSFTSFGQTYNADLSVCDPTPQNMMATSLGNMFSYTIQPTGGTGTVTTEFYQIEKLFNPVGQAYVCDADCGPSHMDGGITFALSGTNATISGTPGDPNLLGYNIVVRFTHDGGQCDATFYLPIENKKPLELALVLDRSGSMGWHYSEETDAPIGQRRWDGLLTGVGSFNEVLDIADLTVDDLLSISLFQSTTIVAPAPFNTGLVNLQNNRNDMVSKLNPLTPGGGTAMGDGILEARDRLVNSPNTDARKVMLVFSDGEQNAGDEVKPDGVTTYGGQKISANGKIKIFTIALGGAAQTLLQSIASQNSGASMSTMTGSESDFTTFFEEQIVNITAENSPQYVLKKKGSIPVPASTDSVPTIEETFYVSKGSTGVSVTVFIGNNYEPQFINITKDGTDLSQYVQRRSGLNYINFHIKTPVTGLPGLTLDGEWKVRLVAFTRPKQPIPYRFSAISNDHLLKAGYANDKFIYRVDDTLKARVSLRHIGQPVKGADVKVLVMKPGADINNLVATSNVNYEISADDPGSPDGAKLSALLKDPAFLDQIKAVTDSVTLTYDSAAKGYTGAYSGLGVTGVYNLLYMVSHDDPAVGKIRRFQRKTLYVLFKDVDIPNSNVSVTVDAQGHTVINWRPVSSNGNLIGTGWGDAIGIDGATIIDVEDHGDGSYTVVVDATPDKEVTVSVADQDVYQGTLEDMDSGGECKILGIPCWLFWLIVVILIIILIWIIRKLK